MYILTEILAVLAVQTRKFVAMELQFKELKAEVRALKAERLAKSASPVDGDRTVPFDLPCQTKDQVEELESLVKEDAGLERRIVSPCTSPKLIAHNMGIIG